MRGTILHFIWGAVAMGAATSALFFLKFWRETRDRFFLMFALAFFLLGLNWLGLALTNAADEARTWVYFVRLGAFLLILAAILDKNRSSSG